MIWTQLHLSVLIVACACKYVSTLPRTIRLGGLFDEDCEEQEQVFQIAVDWVNSEKTVLPNTTLIIHKSRNGKTDSFKATEKVCSLLEVGVAGIFGPESPVTAFHIQSMCDALEMPHIDFRWDYRLQRDDLSVNFHPSSSALSLAYLGIVKRWGWREFFLLYEEYEGILRLQDFLKESGNNNWTVHVYQFSREKTYRYTFRQIRRAALSLSWDEIRIVMDVPRENLKTILKQAQQVEMITEKNHYIITSLDLHTIDLEDFQYSKCNITGLRLLNEESVEYDALLAEINARSYRKKKRRTKTITSASAMIFDSVQLFAKALDELDAGKKIDSFPSLKCDDSNIKGTDGTTIINYMKSSKVHGLTGVVHFDGQGFRSSFTLDIMQLSSSGLKRIGSVMPGGIINITDFVSIEEFNDFNTKRRKFVITTIKNEPFTMLKISRQKLTGNDRFEGFSIDLIEALSKELDFDYEIRLVADELYGREVDREKKIWNGMIGEVLRGDADMAVADVTISTTREGVVDFTMPFMSTGIGLLIKKPTEKVKSLFSFLSPFSTEVWIFVMAVVLGVSSVLCFVGKLSPYEWENKTPCNQDDTSLDNEFTMLNSMWFTFGSLMQQGCEVAPRSSSTRTIASFWYFFTLIMISSYTANLAAFLTIEKVVYPIENVKDLAKQTKIKYGCVGTGSTRAFFETSNIPTYKKMWDFMKANPDVFMQSNEQGKERVSQGNYVFLMESASIEFTVERKCNLTQVGGLLDSKAYGIATRKGNHSLAAWLSPAILKLQEQGVLHSLKDKWWKQKRGGGFCQESSGQSGSVRELGLSNVGGVFVVLLMGIIMAATVAVLEFLWKFRKFRTNTQESVGKLLMEEVKLALTCGSSVKKLQNKRKVQDR